METIFSNLHGNLLQKDKEVEIERKFSFGKKPGREDGDKNMETTIKKRFTSRKKRFFPLPRPYFSEKDKKVCDIKDKTVKS